VSLRIGLSPGRGLKDPREGRVSAASGSTRCYLLNGSCRWSGPRARPVKRHYGANASFLLGQHVWRQYISAFPWSASRRGDARPAARRQVTSGEEPGIREPSGRPPGADSRSQISDFRDGRNRKAKSRGRWATRPWSAPPGGDWRLQISDFRDRRNGSAETRGTDARRPRYAPGGDSTSRFQIPDSLFNPDSEIESKGLIET
jgi:hypothetical protein